jgi:hypothetical protein
VRPEESAQTYRGVMAFIDTRMSAERPPGARALARAIQTELGLSVHPRSIERALARKKQ